MLLLGSIVLKRLEDAGCTYLCQRNTTLSNQNWPSTFSYVNCHDECKAFVSFGLGNLGITSQTEKTESRERVPQSLDMAAGGVERSGVKANSAAAVAAAGDAVICPIDSDGEREGEERREG